MDRQFWGTVVWAALVSAAAAVIIVVATVELVHGADFRFCGPPLRDADGRIVRDRVLLLEFERLHPRPQDGRRWYRDHVIPLACGGCDSIENLQWLPEEAWRDKSRWERRVYGGQGISEGCP